MATREFHVSSLRLLAFGLAVLLPLVLGGTAARAALAIATSATSNVTCSSGVCTATAATAVLNIDDLKQLLRTSDLRVASGNSAHDIVFNAALKWTGYHRLTLDAYRSIVVRKPIISEGAGAVALITNDGSKIGTFTIEGMGSITFWDLNTSFTINGYGYRLVGDIATLAAYIAASPTSLYALARDYNASGDGTYASSPIPTAFTGVFDGLGHTVSNLTMKVVSGSPSGLFALAQGTVRNFGLTQAVMPAGNVCVQAGLLAAQNTGTILNTFATGSIDCFSGTTSGGLVGENTGGTIDRSWAAVDINARRLHPTGGLVGENTGTVIRSHATGNIVGGGYVGGLIGQNDSGQVTQSYATGSVDALHYAGGLVAYLLAGEISDDYATGAITGDAPAYLGGLIALVGGRGLVERSYAAGTIRFGQYQGGLIGEFQKPSNPSGYWDIDTVSKGCGVGVCNNIVGLTTAQFQSGLPAGFDPKIWGENATINNGFPYLLANPPQ